MKSQWTFRLAVGALLLGSGCAIGPNYHRPAAVVSSDYKELAGWKPAAPKDAIDRGAWWSVYNDPDLDRFERQIAISNQNIKVYEAQYAEALALVREVQSELWPTLGVTGAGTRGSGNSTSVLNSTAGATASHGTQYQLEGTGTWTLDVWGAIRRQLESQKAAAQVSKADLANALLSAQATLAQDYFYLRSADSLQDLLSDAVKGYARTAQITENQYKEGTATRGDYMSALAQLKETQAQLTAVRETRGQYEHAIAVLTGTPPAEFSISHGALAVEVPVVPVGLPSELLERNPTIAAAEREMKSENALIGVAETAYFPTITLSGLLSFSSTSLPHLISAANRIWSLGGSAAETVFKGGYQSAEVAAARANYDAAVATYRQTVLSTFQSVEDQLVALHTLQDETADAEQAVSSAKEAADVALNEYNAGTVVFTTVIVANETSLADQQTLLTIKQNRLLASVALIEALGGGWDASKL